MNTLVHKIGRDKRKTKVGLIDPTLLQAYVSRQITSQQLAAETGMNASYLRRAIKREAPQPRTSKRPLIEARKAYRASISHLPVAEIIKLAHISKRTAQRLRAEHAKLAPHEAQK